MAEHVPLCFDGSPGWRVAPGHFHLDWQCSCGSGWEEEDPQLCGAIEPVLSAVMDWGNWRPTLPGPDGIGAWGCRELSLLPGWPSLLLLLLLRLHRCPGQPLLLWRRASPWPWSRSCSGAQHLPHPASFGVLTAPESTLALHSRFLGRAQYPWLMTLAECSHQSFLLQR